MENYLKYFHTIFYLFITTIAEEKLSLLDNLLLFKRFNGRETTLYIQNLHLYNVQCFCYNEDPYLIKTCNW